MNITTASSIDRRTFVKTLTVAGGAIGLAGIPEVVRADAPPSLPSRPVRRIEKARAPLNILILGGTGFTGPEQVEYAIARGHRVTLFNRNKTRPDFFKGKVAEELVGDLNGDGIQMIPADNAHSDADTLVNFRRADVIVAGDILDLRGFPIIDVENGGTINGEVVLLVDTFNNYFESDNARAALAVLRAAGYLVHLPRAVDDARPLCCGRTFLAAGLVDEARAEARRMLETLKPFVERGVPVIGLEPSCLFGLRDEFLSMLPGSDTAALAMQAMLFEEFIAREIDAGRFKLNLKPLVQKRVPFHYPANAYAADLDMAPRA